MNIIYNIMFRWLIEFDKETLLYLNSIHAPMWDEIMWWASKTITWIPLYVVLIVFIIYRERPRQFIYTLVFAAIVILLSDRLSVIIKDFVERPRPTHNPEIAYMVHIVNNYSGQVYGFVSSHATNVFAVATFLSNQFKDYKWSLLLFTWAVVISYSRIYLGVHYPLDIIFGALLGILIGMLCYVFKMQIVMYTERCIEINKEKKRHATKLSANS